MITEGISVCVRGGLNKQSGLRPPCKETPGGMAHTRFIPYCCAVWTKEIHCLIYPRSSRVLKNIDKTSRAPGSPETFASRNSTCAALVQRRKTRASFQQSLPCCLLSRGEDVLCEVAREGQRPHVRVPQAILKQWSDREVGAQLQLSVPLMVLCPLTRVRPAATAAQHFARADAGLRPSCGQTLTGNPEGHGSAWW